MKERSLGIIMNGVTGRMGTNQHLVRSILAIRRQGGVRLDGGDVVVPDPILVGRNPDKLKALAQAHGVARFTTDLDAALKDPFNEIYFDSQTTDRRAEGVRRAIAAKKAIYCEKPTAADTATALALYRECQAAGLKNGVVQDKLWCCWRGLGQLSQFVAPLSDLDTWSFVDGLRRESIQSVPHGSTPAHAGCDVIYDHLPLVLGDLLHRESHRVSGRHTDWKWWYVVGKDLRFAAKVPDAALTIDRRYNVFDPCLNQFLKLLTIGGCETVNTDPIKPILRSRRRGNRRGNHDRVGHLCECVLHTRLLEIPGPVVGCRRGSTSGVVSDLLTRVSQHDRAARDGRRRCRSGGPRSEDDYA